MKKIKSTTVFVIRHNNKTTMAADGQVTFGDTVLKGNAKKIQVLGNEKKVLAGFAGSAADGLNLLVRFEEKLNQFSYDLSRAAIELAKDWRQDRYLRRLEALLLVANREHIYLLSGTGEVIEPHETLASIGSGGDYARSAGLALLRNASQMSSLEIARESLKIASELCIYTNNNFIIEEL